MLDMIDQSLVVQSAISSFNNAAIAAPSFFWSALLMFPIFFLVWRFGNNFISGLKWNGLADPKKRTSNFAFCAEVVIMAWLLLMHGNYAVLRDNVSWLPVTVAAILFVVTASVMQKFKAINPPRPAFLARIRWPKITITVGAIIGIALVGLSGMPTWWGFLMQSAAVVCGIIVGYRWKRVISPILITSLLMFAISTIVLMQPEFFRFGQLGHLTLIHLFFVLMAGALGMAVIALRNINPRGRIHTSAFVKLKWMVRIIVGLCVILFVLTESVPVFLALNVCLAILFAMSVWHATTIPENLAKKLWAALLCVFGIMTGLPVITALGILYWTTVSGGNTLRQSGFLL